MEGGCEHQGRRNGFKMNEEGRGVGWFQRETMRSESQIFGKAQPDCNACVRTKDAAPPGGRLAVGARELRRRPGGQTQGPAGKVGGSDAFSSVC